MKLNKTLSHKIFKFYLLKLKVSEQNSGSSNFNAAPFLTSLKKTLFLILQFHKSGKRILFVGFSEPLRNCINKSATHVSISPTTDLKGSISNGLHFSFIEGISNRVPRKVSSPARLKRKPDLVVTLSHNQKNLLLKECLKQKIPFVSYSEKDGYIDINSLVKFGKKGTQSLYFKEFFEMCVLFLVNKIFKHFKTHKLKKIGPQK